MGCSPGMVRGSLTKSDVSHKAARRKSPSRIEGFFNAAMKIEVRRCVRRNIESGFPFGWAEEQRGIEFQFSAQRADTIAKVRDLLERRFVVLMWQQREVHDGSAANQDRRRHPGRVGKAAQRAQ